MDIEKYDFLWTEKKRQYVIVKSVSGEAIINRKEREMFLVSDKKLLNALLEKMRQENNEYYENIKDAFDSWTED